MPTPTSGNRLGVSAGSGFTVDDSALKANGQTFATFAHSEGMLHVNFQTGATPALVQDVLRHITYAYETTDPKQPELPDFPVSLQWTFDDGETSSLAFSQVKIATAAPTFTASLSDGVLSFGGTATGDIALSVAANGALTATRGGLMVDGSFNIANIKGVTVPDETTAITLTGEADLSNFSSGTARGVLNAGQVFRTVEIDGTDYYFPAQLIELSQVDQTSVFVLKNGTDAYVNGVSGALKTGFEHYTTTSIDAITAPDTLVLDMTSADPVTVYGVKLGTDSEADILDLKGLTQYEFGQQIQSVEVAGSTTAYGDVFLNKSFLNVKLTLDLGNNQTKTVELIDLIALDTLVAANTTLLQYLNTQLGENNTLSTTYQTLSADGTTKLLGMMNPNLEFDTLAFVSAEVNGATLTLTYDDALGGTPPATTAFTVLVNNVEVTVNSRAIDGSDSTKLNLTLANAVKSGDTVKIAYTNPSVDDSVNTNAAIQDAAGHDAANLSAGTVVSNVTAETATPTITSATYDVHSGVLTVTGTGFLGVSGDANDIDVSKLSISGPSSTHTLTSGNVEITSSTSFSITLNDTDKTALASVTANGNVSGYNLAAAAGWAAASPSAEDLVRNPVTLTNLATDMTNVTPDLMNASDTGASNTDNLTHDTTPTVSINMNGKTGLAAGNVIQMIDTSNSNAVVGSYTIQSGDLSSGEWQGASPDITLSALSAGNHALKVRIFDSATNIGAPSSTALTVTVDTTTPTFQAVTLTGTDPTALNLLTLRYDEVLDDTNLPEEDAFVIKVGGSTLANDGSAYTITGVSGHYLTITLKDPVAANDTVTVAYGTAVIQDLAGNDAADLAETPADRDADGDGVAEDVDYDGNGDNTPDSQQTTVTSLPVPGATGSYITVVTREPTAGDGFRATVAVSQAPAAADLPEDLQGSDIPAWALSVDMTGVTPGASETIRFYVDADVEFNRLVKQKKDGTWAALENVTVTLEGNRRLIEFSVEDNGDFDRDPADGKISDPVVLVKAANTAPVIKNAAAVNVPENTKAVTTVTVDDPDLGDTVTYSITGGDDHDKFNINATTGELTFKSAPDFEAPTDTNSNGKNTYIVNVTATDGANAKAVQTITATVTNVSEGGGGGGGTTNTAPTIISNGGGAAGAVSIAENTTAVTTVTATDPNAGDSVTYSISGGADADKFSIDATTGVLSFKTAPDFETPQDVGDTAGNNTYAVAVTATDKAGASDSQSLTVRVTNVNDAPTGTVSISGNLVKGQTLTASNTLADADGLGTITYQWQANGTAIDGATGSTYVLTQAEVGKTITVAASYTDGLGTAERVVSSATVAVTEGNQAPTSSNGAVVTLEDTAYVFKTADFKFNDADAGDALVKVAITALPKAGTLAFSADSKTWTPVTLGQEIGKVDLEAGHLRFTPAENANGKGYASLGFKVSDGKSLSTAAYTLAVNVTPVRDDLTLTGTTGNDTLKGDAIDVGSYDRLIGLGGNDHLLGYAGNDILEGGAGNDILNGGTGADKMTGGNGADRYYVDHAGDQVIETNATARTGGIDTVYSSLARYTLGANVENGRILSTGAANLTGNALDNLLIAGAGDNVIRGGAGIDTVSYAQGVAGKAGVTVSLAVTTAQATGGSGTDTLIGIENLTGSSYADTLTGNGAHNVLKGGAGNDSLDGGAGNDILDGGTGADKMTGGNGADRYYVDHAGDQVIETNATARTGGIDTVYSALARYTLGENVENGRILSTGAANLTGNALDNLLIAGTGDNVIRGGAGIDTVSYAQGVAGKAGVTVSLAVTTAQATGGSGTDTLIGIENLTGSSYADTLTGNGGRNVLKGGAGNDSLDGGAGNDLLIGGTGKDVLTGGAGRDVFRFDAALAANNVDRITDFSVVDDTIQLENAIFTSLTATGKLAVANFRVIGSGTVLDSDDFILYEAKSGKLFYDADGSGTAEAVQFAIIGTNLALTAADFVVI